MNKTKRFKSFLLKNQVSVPENLTLILDWINKDELITFFSWKLFKIVIRDNKVIASPKFNTIEAMNYISREKEFLDLLIKLRVKFRYLKLIPDELPKIFFNRKLKRASSVYANNVSKYFRRIYLNTEVLQMTEILKNKRLIQLYKTVYEESGKVNISNIEFNKEVESRSIYYTTKPLTKKQSESLATKAFSVFAAETAIIFKYFKNPVLLAGARSVDTYKYEFFKYPKNRPVLPKLFVI